MDLASFFTAEEILGIREGVDGTKRPLPARFYHDEAIYQYEVDNILKKNWMCVGRWDQAENPGDYFTVRMWGESIVVVRDKNRQLHALVNVCQHRWSQVVADGSGNTRLFVCPYHRWSYNLDGTLRGISVQNIPEVDKKKCRMPSLRIEEWQGFIMINFDPEAEPLAPQLEAIDPLLERYDMSRYQHYRSLDYQADWNWKFSFETGYEGYHHAGLHHDRINHIEPAVGARPLDFGRLCGSYLVPFAEDVPREISQPFGPPPGTSEKDAPDDDVFIAVYPNLIMYSNHYQVTYIVTEHRGVELNQCSTRQSFAPWALESPLAEELLPTFTTFTDEVQNEDTLGCRMLQKGVRSTVNDSRGYIHPLETQLNHYHNWYLDQYPDSLDS